MFTPKLYTALLAAVFLVACNAKQEAVVSDDKMLKVQVLEAPQYAPVPEAPPPPPPGDATTLATGSNPSVSPASAAPSVARKIIYHADVRIKVDDLVRANARMDSLTRSFGAYVSGAAETREAGQWNHQMKIRVAPSRFQAMLSQLNGLGTLESKTLSTEDVTAEHADVLARLRTKRAVEQRYVALLTQAKKISDVLEIEEKIGEVREAIESTESRLKTLDDEVAYSTITLTYFQILAKPTPDLPVLSFRSRLAESFYNGWELLTGLVLALVTAWPLLLLGGIVLVALRAWKRRRAAQQLVDAS